MFRFCSQKGEVLYFWLLEEGVLQSGVRREEEEEERGERRAQSHTVQRTERASPSYYLDYRIQN